MKKYFFVLIVFVFTLTGVVYADYYTWEDENGVRQITDYPPPKTLKARHVKVHKRADSSSDQQEEEAAPVRPKAAVLLYTKNNCPDCDKAREYLQSANSTFTEFNMDADEKAAEIRKALDDSDDVPFAIINNQQVYGFSEAVYARLLRASP